MNPYNKIAKYTFRKNDEVLSSSSSSSSSSSEGEEEEEQTNEQKHQQPVELDEEEKLILRQMTGNFSKLPLEITYDILSRVPIKTLSQSCRWVSKSWFKIVRNPRFAQIQHAKASQIFSPCVSYFNLRFKSFYLVDHQVFDNHETSTTVHLPDISEKSFGWAFDVVGACNGLICMAPDHLCYKPQPYFIFNPITREHITLPNSPLYKFPHRSSAFAFDPVTNEHKIVRIIESGEVEIYTLGSGPYGWRRISNAPYYVPTFTVFVNGALHWTIFKKSERRYGIIALDMATEQFREIPPPPYDSSTEREYKFKSVAVIGDNLCFSDGDFDEHIEIWVMKSYGILNSWSKEYVLNKKSFPFRVWNDGYQVIKLACGELLLKHTGKGASLPFEKDLLHYYDPKRKVFKHIKTHGIPSDVTAWGNFSCLKPIVHVGNLISPKNIGRSKKSYCKKGDSSKSSTQQSVSVPVASNQVFKSDAEVFTNSESLKYVYNYAYEGHNQTKIVLEKGR